VKNFYKICLGVVLATSTLSIDVFSREEVNDTFEKEIYQRFLRELQLEPGLDITNIKALSEDVLISLEGVIRKNFYKDSNITRYIQKILAEIDDELNLRSAIRVIKQEKNGALEPVEVWDQKGDPPSIKSAKEVQKWYKFLQRIGCDELAKELLEQQEVKQLEEKINAYNNLRKEETSKREKEREDLEQAVQSLQKTISNSSDISTIEGQYNGFHQAFANTFFDGERISSAIFNTCLDKIKAEKLDRALCAEMKNLQMAVTGLTKVLTAQATLLKERTCSEEVGIVENIEEFIEETIDKCNSFGKKVRGDAQASSDVKSKYLEKKQKEIEKLRECKKNLDQLQRWGQLQQKVQDLQGTIGSASDIDNIEKQYNELHQKLANTFVDGQNISCTIFKTCSERIKAERLDRTLCAEMEDFQNEIDEMISIRDDMQSVFKENANLENHVSIADRIKEKIKKCNSLYEKIEKDVQAFPNIKNKYLEESKKKAQQLKKIEGEFNQLQSIQSRVFPQQQRGVPRDVEKEGERAQKDVVGREFSPTETALESIRGNDDTKPKAAREGTNGSEMFQEGNVPSGDDVDLLEEEPAADQEDVVGEFPPTENALEESIRGNDDTKPKAAREGENGSEMPQEGDVPRSGDDVGSLQEEGADQEGERLGESVGENHSSQEEVYFPPAGEATERPEDARENVKLLSFFDKHLYKTGGIGLGFCCGMAYILWGDKIFSSKAPKKPLLINSAKEKESSSKRGKTQTIQWKNILWKAFQVASFTVVGGVIGSIVDYFKVKSIKAS
jgi:predicted nucleotidyltransferase